MHKREKLLEKYYETNRKRWNELVGVHAKSEEYDLEGFLEGKNSLHSIELNALGNVLGKSLLHLQCHFGLDTLSWGRLGASVTGVDFSDTAIELAKEIAKKVGVKAEFINCNIYDLSNYLDGEFDIVYTSYGVLCWLHDLDGWAKVIAHYLKPGGTFFIAELHPFMGLFDDEHPSELHVKYSYWQGEEPTYWEADGSYAEPEAKIENKGDYEWVHPISEVINALIKAGLTIQEFNEYPYTVYQQLPFMKLHLDGYTRLPGDKLPLLYSIKATKE